MRNKGDRRVMLLSAIGWLFARHPATLGRGFVENNVVAMYWISYKSLVPFSAFLHREGKGKPLDENDLRVTW